MRPYFDAKQVRSWADTHRTQACALWRGSARWRRWLASPAGDPSLAHEMPQRCAAERAQAIEAVAGATDTRIKSLVDHATSASPTRRAQGRRVLQRVQQRAQNGDPRAREAWVQIRAVCISRGAQRAAVGGVFRRAPYVPERGRWSLR